MWILVFVTSNALYFILNMLEYFLYDFIWTTQCMISFRSCRFKVCTIEHGAMFYICLSIASNMYVCMGGCVLFVLAIKNVWSVFFAIFTLYHLVFGFKYFFHLVVFESVIQNHWVTIIVKLGTASFGLVIQTNTQTNISHTFWGQVYAAKWFLFMSLNTWVFIPKTL